MGIITGTRHFFDRTTSDSTNLVTSTLTQSQTTAFQVVSVLNTVAAGTAPTLALTGPAGSQWSQIGTQTFNTNLKRVSVFRSMGAWSNSSGSLRIDADGTTITSWFVEAMEFGNVTTTGDNGENAVAASATTTATASQLTMKMSSFASTKNGVYAVFGFNANEVATVGSNLTRLSANGLGTPTTGFVTCWWDEENTTPDAFFSGSVAGRGIAIELSANTDVAASGGVAGTSVALRQALSRRRRRS